MSQGQSQLIESINSLDAQTTQFSSKNIWSLRGTTINNKNAFLLKIINTHTHTHTHIILSLEETHLKQNLEHPPHKDLPPEKY